MCHYGPHWAPERRLTNDSDNHTNGFSELMVQVFGEEAGKGARSAVGMGALPSNIAVEIEAIFEVRG